jgi:hypothetical protein
MKKRDAWPLLLLGLGGAVLLAGAGSASAEPMPASSPGRRRREPARVPETDNRTALARVIHSEAGTQTMAERVAVAWVARNAATRRGLTIAQLVCAPCGPQAGWPRPFSSRLPARETDLVVADAVLTAPTSEDRNCSPCPVVTPPAGPAELGGRCTTMRSSASFGAS